MTGCNQCTHAMINKNGNYYCLLFHHRISPDRFENWNTFNCDRLKKDGLLRVKTREELTL